jgi:hypothetical protein
MVLTRKNGIDLKYSFPKIDILIPTDEGIKIKGKTK